jgi:death-on-curing protein
VGHPTAVEYLTLEEVLLLHARLIQRTGGSGGVRDMGLLDSALARPRATFGGEDLYPSLWHKAAALMHSLIKNHPFVDGNKRTALTATGLFLEVNGYTLTASNEQVLDFAKRAAVGKGDIKSIAMWLEKHSKAINEPGVTSQAGDN